MLALTAISMAFDRHLMGWQTRLPGVRRCDKVWKAMIGILVTQDF
jgi:hypothetical protein